MRQLASILLLFTFTGLATGALSLLHELDHAHEAADAHHDHGPATPAHDDADCNIHTLLRAPIDTPSAIPLLVFLGLFIAFLSLIAPPLLSQRLPARINCRGPPIL